MNQIWVFLATAATLALAGCVPVHDGTVAMKINDRIAHIGIEAGATLQVGSKVALIESQCSSGAKRVRRRRPPPNCRQYVRGTGTVIEILNERYAVAEFPLGLGFEEGDAVEPVRPGMKAMWEREL